VLEDSACRVTVRPAHEAGRLGNDIYRYISGEGAAVRLGCRWCPPSELVQRLRDNGINAPPTPDCNSGVKWQVVYESNAWMRPDWGALQARAQPGVALHGYLQSWDYHKHHTSLLAFAQQAACDVVVRRACPDGGPDVSMHVRGTDAIANGIGPRAEHFLPHVHGCVVVVSDEPKWVKKHLPASVHYVHESPAIDMCVAGSGRQKVVLTAGTFDLFSAYFRRHRDAQVLMDPRTFRWDMLSGAEGERALASYAPREWLSSTELTIVATFSAEMIKVANNWVSFLQKHDLKPILYALDSNTCNKISRAATCLETQFSRPVLNLTVEMQKDVAYQGQNYLRNTNKKLRVFVDALDNVANNSWVLFSDVDVIFLQSPAQYLASKLPFSANFLFQQALTTCDNSKGIKYVMTQELVCTGLFYVKANKYTRSVLRQAMHSPSFDHADQGSVNFALREHNVPIQLLPCDKFPNGYVYQHQVTRSAIAVHFNYISTLSEKVKMMKKKNMWNLPGTTIVTAYYPIQSKHSKQEYRVWMRNMLSLRDPMVIYTTANVARDVRRQRAHAPTRVVVRALADLPIVAKHGAAFWEAQHAKDPERALHPDWRLYVIWQSKSWFLAQTARADPFGTAQFAWIDVGYLRTPEYNDELLFCPSRLLPASKVTMLDVTSLGASNNLGGGFIGGDAASVAAWHTTYLELIEKGAKQGHFIGKDQPWMWRACAEHTERCNIVTPKPYAGDPWFYMAAAVHAC